MSEAAANPGGPASGQSPAILLPATLLNTWKPKMAGMVQDIVIKGAREHNLKNISLTLPRDKCIVITGLSGSGKSTLAFDTLYAEGQRRYVESLSSYARQFLGLMDKPDVDSIEGLSPAISIEQKTTSKNPRSTVGTVTEIYDYLRLLFARIGTIHCPKCQREITGQTPDQITDNILARFDGEKIQVLASVIRKKKGTYEKLIYDIRQKGFARVRINNQIISSDENPKLDRYKQHTIEIVIDRFQNPERSRLQEAVESALREGKGLAMVLDERGKEHVFSAKTACPKCDISFEEIQPRLFSFNSPFGACPACHGLGIKQEFDPELVLPDKSKAFIDGGVAPWGNHVDGWRYQQLGSAARHFKIDLTKPISSISGDHLKILLYGSEERIKYSYMSKTGDSSYSGYGEFEGIIPQLDRIYKETESDWRRDELERFMHVSACPLCKGRRLKPEALAVKIANKSIMEVTELSVSAELEFFRGISLSQTQTLIAKTVIKEVLARLSFLENVGIGYLTLSRSAGTLSGGEAQRIRLATQIGSNLTGVMYILDEPSIGLHQRDNAKLISTLHRLRDLGNTVIVVEHDAETIENSDWVVDLGPGAGIFGGSIVAQGTPGAIKKNRDSLTGKYLSGRLTIASPKNRRGSTRFITIKGPTENNLKGMDVSFPVGVFTCVTGVSGSGKSTLVSDILHKALMKRLHNSKDQPGKHNGLVCDKEVEKVIVIDQSPIGRTPRSNPATYTKLFDEIRCLFSATKEAKLRGYKEGRFSFNVKGGRCENCQGDGLIKIEMNFLPDVYISCEECKGERYNKETLAITFKGKTIAEVLGMSVDEALIFFDAIPLVKRRLQTLWDVGLSYIKLGQSSTTLSGGEAQRIKLTRELAKTARGHTVYLLDEPTTGLHFDDVKKLLAVLNRLVDKSNSVIVIEHNVDVIKTADWIIDLGPEGGDAGGYIVAQGSPEHVAKNSKSYTGMYLRKVLQT